jgi:hypothetical protein
MHLLVDCVDTGFNDLTDCLKLRYKACTKRKKNLSWFIIVVEGFLLRPDDELSL